MSIGVDVLPPIPKDSTDRNRTSPFAFTGNRFEFRSVGSSLSISGPNTTLDAILAYSLKEYADELEKSDNFEKDLQNLVKREITAHWRIVFDGNGYDGNWVKEAEKRGLLNLRTLPDAMEEYLKPKNIKLYNEMGVYSETELKSHYEIKLEKYVGILNIEVETMLEMINKDILPATFKYMETVGKSAAEVRNLVPEAKCAAQSSLLKKLDDLAEKLSEKANALSEKHSEAKKCSSIIKTAHAYADTVIPAMEEARAVADKIEPLLSEEFKPYPSYEDLLFSV